MNDLYIEQPIVLKTLDNMIKKERVPHALIFNGDKSTSKKEVAKEFIKMMYSKFYNEDINNSLIGHRIDDESHSNIVYVKKDAKTAISIDLVRDLISEANETSLEDGPRFYVFEDGDYLNTNSSNAILKFVEEPVENVYIIFIVENMYNLLDTIISRCVCLNFRPLNKEFLKDRLDLKGYEPAILRVLMEYTQNESLIDKIISDNDYMNIYNFVVDMFSEKIEVNGSFILSLLEHYNLLDIDEHMDFFLSLFVIYLKDIFYYQVYNDEEKLVFRSEKGRIKKLSNLFVKEEISNFIKEALEIKSSVNNKQPINTHLYLDNLLLKMENKLRK